MLTIQQKFPIKDNHTFGVEIVSDMYAEPGNNSLLLEYAEFGRSKNLPVMIMGEGSNLLFKKDFNGMIIRPMMQEIEILEQDFNHIIIKAGAGLNWDSFVQYCVDNNYYGLENLSLIPGSVGASPVQNIGAYGVEARDLIQWTEVVDLKKMKKEILTAEQCEFGYRDSIFKHGEKNRYIVTGVVFKLDKLFNPNLDYGNVREEYGNHTNSGAASLRETIISIRRKKLPDPQKHGNAGSFFKNPIVARSYFDELLKTHDKIPSFNMGNGHLKIPAAWLIENAGWKGKREGDVGTWPHQPLVIVNYGGATGADIFNFSEKIRESVKDRFGINLQREVTVIDL